MAEEQILKITRRHLPHWTFPDSTYFVTYRLCSKPFSDDEVAFILDHLKSGDRVFYALIAATVMPDHVHLIFAPKAEFDLSRIMKGIKGKSSRLLNIRRGTAGNNWQDESWDRIIRNEDDFKEKLNYMYMNAVKRGLTTEPEKYIGWYFNAEAAGYGGNANV
jgi:putative transposase